MAEDPGEAAHLRVLGSTLYDAGEVRILQGDLAGAVATLRRAEEAYQELAAAAGAPTRTGLWIADVRVRRARALAAQGRAASALADAQAGLLAYRERWSTSPEDPLTLGPDGPAPAHLRARGPAGRAGPRDELGRA